MGVGNNPRGCQDSVRKPGVGRRLGTNGFFSKESMGQVMDSEKSLETAQDPLRMLNGGGR